MDFGCYQIMDVTTGLYSTGGGSPHFTRRGKIWSSLAFLTAHLTHQMSDRTVYFYDANMRRSDPHTYTDEELLSSIPETWVVVNNRTEILSTAREHAKTHCKQFKEN